MRTSMVLNSCGGESVGTGPDQGIGFARFPRAWSESLVQTERRSSKPTPKPLGPGSISASARKAGRCFCRTSPTACSTSSRHVDSSVRKGPVNLGTSHLESVGREPG